jgi:hypothetical protein
MKRLLVSLTLLVSLSVFASGCGSSGTGSSGGQLKLNEQQMKDAQQAQMKNLMQQKGDGTSGMKK